MYDVFIMYFQTFTFAKLFLKKCLILDEYNLNKAFYDTLDIRSVKMTFYQTIYYSQNCSPLILI